MKKIKKFLILGVIVGVLVISIFKLPVHCDNFHESTYWPQYDVLEGAYYYDLDGYGDFIAKYDDISGWEFSVDASYDYIIGDVDVSIYMYYIDQFNLNNNRETPEYDFYFYFEDEGDGRQGLTIYELSKYESDYVRFIEDFDPNKLFFYFSLGVEWLDGDEAMPLYYSDYKIYYVGQNFYSSEIEQARLNGYAQGYESGQNHGLEIGEQVGYNRGYNVGVAEGYESGYIVGENEATNTAKTWFSGIFSGFQNFFNIDIGNMKLGVILLIPFSISVAWFIIKQFRGGGN